MKVVKDGKWYVQYSVRDVQTDEMKRFRIYEGFEQISDERGRIELAQKLVDEYTDKLEKSWTPYDRPKVLYEDVLMYSNEADISSRLRHQSPSADTYMSEFLEEKRSEITLKTYQTYVSKLRLFNLYLRDHGKDREIVQLIDNDLLAELN